MRERVSRLEELLGDEEGPQGERVIPCFVYFHNLEALETALKPFPFPFESVEVVHREPTVKRRIPELQEFHGRRSTREVENFI